jgi:DNA-binding winged helix-turn-helix (wHTH) protein
VWLNNVELDPPLSLPQFRLLQVLFDRQGKVVERQDLINYIWGEEEAVGVSEQAFDALVRRLRDRLMIIDPSHSYIVTVRGHGLRLDNPSA